MASLFKNIERDFIAPFKEFNQSDTFSRKPPMVLPEGPMSRDIPAGPQSFARQTFGPVAPRPVVTQAPAVDVQAAGGPSSPESEATARLRAEQAQIATGGRTPEEIAARIAEMSAQAEASSARQRDEAAAPPVAPPPTDDRTATERATQFLPRPVITGTEDQVRGFEIPEPRTLEDIRKEQLAQAQSMIDATQGIFQQEISRLEQQGQERLAQTSSILTSAGLAGTPFQLTGQEKSKQATNEILAARQAERRAEVAKIMAQAQDRATDIYDREVTRHQAERRLRLSEDEADRLRLKSIATAAKESISNIVASGSSLDELNDTDPTSYQRLLSDSGLSDFEAKAFGALSAPEANAQFSQQGDRFVGGYYDAATGQFKTIVSDAIPELAGAADSAKLQLIDGVPYVISTDAEGNLSGSLLPGFVEAAPEDKLLSDSLLREFGLPFGTTVSEAVAMGLVPSAEGDKIKPPTTAQSQAASFVVRMRQATPTLDALESKFAEVGSKIPGIPEFLKSEDRKLFEQAERNFINSVLRRESGAAIAESEFDSARLQYIPQAGDTAAVLAEKRATRSAILEGMEREAGSALFTPSSAEFDPDSFFDDDDAFLESFNNDLSTSEKGLTGKGDVLALGNITGFGSSLWKHGLDIDLKIGDPVPTPSSGEVIFTGNNGGFGKQVKIKTAKGNEVWLSHLDSINVKVGDRISKGQFIGKGGNTGKTIPLGGGDGSHLDLTVQRPDGSFFDPRDIANLLA